MLLYHGLDFVVFSCHVSRLTEGGIVVIAGDSGLVNPVIVGAVGKAKVGAAVEHVEVHRTAAGEHFIKGSSSVVSLPDVVGFIPVVEPAVPELTAHSGLIRPEGLEEGEVFLALAAKVGGGQIAVQGAAAQHIPGGAVGGEVEAADLVVLVDVHHGLEVFLVIAVAAVLVFNLHHQDVAAIASKEGRNLLEQGLIIPADLGEIERIIAAQFHFLVTEQPGRQAAELQLSADVGAGTKNDIQAQLLGSPDKPGNVQHTGEIKLALFPLVEIPAGVGLYGIKTAGLQLLQPVLPVFRHDPEVVNGAGQDGKGLSIQQKMVLVIGEIWHKYASF